MVRKIGGSTNSIEAFSSVLACCLNDCEREFGASFRGWMVDARICKLEPLVKPVAVMLA